MPRWPVPRHERARWNWTSSAAATSPWWSARPSATCWLATHRARGWTCCPTCTTWPAPGYYDGPERLQPQGDDGLAELFVGGTFEGTTQVLVGLDGGREPFRVFALTEPSRLVVDVQDAGED